MIDREGGGGDVHDDVLITDAVGELGALPEVDRSGDVRCLDGAGGPHARVQHGGPAIDERVDGLLIGLRGHVGSEGAGISKLVDVLIATPEIVIGVRVGAIEDARDALVEAEAG